MTFLARFLKGLLPYRAAPRASGRRRKRVYLRIEALEERVVPVVVTVDTFTDPGGFFSTSLRGAIDKVNASTDATNTINFNILDKDDKQIASPTITLNALLPAISKPVVIDGLRGYPETSSAVRNSVRYWRAME